MSANTNPSFEEGALVISLNEHSSQHTIQKILQVDTLPSPVLKQDSIEGYEWKVDTKYYSATVYLYSVEEKIELDSEFCGKVQAVIFSFDGNEPSSFEGVLSWMPFLKNIMPDVKLLICNSCDSNEIHKKKILDWCVENEFELIELNSSEDTDDDDSGIFSSSKGYGRVIEALQSHTWSNLVMKENTWEPNQVEKAENDSKCCSVSSSKSDEKSKKMTVEDEELTLEEEWLQKVFDGEDHNGGSFEALFSKFASMKERASNLTGEERKKYAEKVAVAFWKAMEGEEEEIEGLDDD